MDNKLKNERRWYNNPNIITTIIITVLFLIILLSQSYAVKNNLTTVEILRNLLNHNTLYIIGLIYFIPLKIKALRKYFNYLNLFLILIYFIFSITSILSIIRSFGLTSLFTLGINIIFLIYMIHTFLKKTRFWKDLKLEKSPFNEIKNDNYFYTLLVFSIIMFTIDLINSTNVDGIIISIVVMIYNILLTRYIYTYQIYIDNHKAISKEYPKDLFVEIESNDKDFPKIKKLIADISSSKLNGYQVIAVVTMGICFVVGIIFGNLFPSCGSSSNLYNSVCNTTEFNFSLTIFIWFIGFLTCVFFYGIGHIILLLESINNNLNKK